MEEKSTKISFGFSKITKKPMLSNPKPEFIKKVDKIQFIDSVENKSFNVINEDKPPEKIELVIPMKSANDLLDSMKEAVKSRIEPSKVVLGDKETGDNIGAEVKKETLDEMAAREIIADLKNEEEEKVVNNFTVPMSEKVEGQKESTLEDYDSIPIKDFGLAMLRGMGWQPTKGIGKNEQVVKTETPQLRPKGMGLGADKVIKPQKPTGMNVQTDSVMKKDSKVRITFGKFKNLYGTVQGFDDDSGRISVQLSIGSEIIWINECFVQLVTISEFDKYSQIINIKTYNEYKDENSDSKEIVNSSAVRSSEKFSKSSNKTNNSSSHSSDCDNTNSKHDSKIFENSKRIKKKDHKKISKTYNSDSISSHDSDSSDKKYNSKLKSKDEITRRTEYSRRDELSKSRYKKNHDSSSDDEHYSKREKMKQDKKHLPKEKRKHSSENSRKHKSYRRNRSSSSEYDRSFKKKHKKKKSRSRSIDEKRRKHR